jgi:hypothetical protein
MRFSCINETEQEFPTTICSPHVHMLSVWTPQQAANSHEVTHSLWIINKCRNSSFAAYRLRVCRTYQSTRRMSRCSLLWSRNCQLYHTNTSFALTTKQSSYSSRTPISLQVYFCTITSSNCITATLQTLPISTFLDAYCRQVDKNAHMVR